MDAIQTIEEFIQYKKARNIRRKTEIAYRSSLKQFFGYIGKPPDQVTIDDIYAYMTQLKLDGRSNNTQKLRQGMLRYFFAWLSKRYHLENPAEDLYPIPEEVKIPIMPTPDEFVRMVYSCDMSNEIGRRNAALLCLAADTGLRVSEIHLLDVANVQLHENNFTVIVPRVKGGRERIVPFAKLTQGNLVSEYWVSYWQDIRFVKNWRDNHPLFVQHGLTPQAQGNRLGIKGIQWVVQQASIRAGLNRRLMPHALRHFFATYSVVYGTDIRALQQLMGHVWIETTLRYVHIAESVTGQTLNTRASSNMASSANMTGFVKILQDAIKQTKQKNRA